MVHEVKGFLNDNNGEPSRKLPRKNSSISYSRLKYKKIVGGGCKLLQFCETSHQFITVQPSPTPNIVKGYFKHCTNLKKYVKKAIFYNVVFKSYFTKSQM